MIFLLGRQAMLGHEPPTYFRSMTAVFIPFFASVQEINLPAAPLPSTRRSYSSGSMAGAGLPAVLGSSKSCVVFIIFPVLFIPWIDLLSSPAPIHRQNTSGDKRIFQQRDHGLRCFFGSANPPNGMQAGQPVALWVVL